ncbi:asparagine synthase [Helicobacter sp. MIT 05-5293]|uniref:asparagine synthase-related protein n=1 Tax=Helicobacter sp. MIT 05-5293 TaxID=1548149 RepID=UPI00051E0BFC|nr:asparagine synthase C-terminal domain-containing protein [Helicobacter sp. MIT 05-5293]TLD82013.1 asparagine synthase [Helicobacter sp. MIT 05-5293]
MKSCTLHHADKIYCMSHYLAFRYIAREDKNFFPNLHHQVFKPNWQSDLITDVEHLDYYIADKMKNLNPNTTGVMLSGGMDSAIVASYLPKGAKAFTLKCIGSESGIDETIQAQIYAKAYHLEHIIVEVHWDEILRRIPSICQFDGVPFHSIEVLIDILLDKAKNLGITTMCLGESFDLVFGGMDKILSKDWEFDEFVNFYTFLDPKLVLKEWVDTREVFEPYRINQNKIDFLRFLDEIFAIESSTSYWHIFQKHNMGCLDPSQKAKLATPLDLQRIRSGDSKYIVRELFARRYPELPIPNKIPMPREVDFWLKDWKGPSRKEFIKDSHLELSGDQKWQLFCLETFLNLFDS